MRIQVEHHADLRAAPRSLHRGERRIAIIEIMDQWYGPGYRYEFADQATDFSNKAKRVVDAVDKLRKQKLYSTEFITGRFKYKGRSSVSSHVVDRLAKTASVSAESIPWRDLGKVDSHPIT